MRHLDTAAVRAGPDDWRKDWLARHDCDLPSVVPYPRAPLGI